MRRPLATLLLASATILAADAAADRIGPGPHPRLVPALRGMIDAVAISSDGRAALTRDDQGNLLFWPSLDGKSEPRVVDVQSPDGMALAPRGGGFTLAVVDTSGGGHVLRAAADGSSRETATTAPTDPVMLLRPIPGEGRVLGIGMDSTIRLYGETGKPLDKIEQRDFRPTELCVAADGKSALVVIEAESIQRVKIGKKKLTLEGEAVRLPAEAATSRFSDTCAPGADRYAFLRNSTLGNGDLELLVVGTDGKELAKQKVPAQLGVGNVAFLSDDSLLLWAPNSSMSTWKYDLKKKELLARGGRPDPFFSSPNEVAAGGRRVTADGTWLFVQDIDAREQRYLGYEDFAPFLVALSPGGVGAFADGNGNILVEDIGGQGRAFLPGRGQMGIGLLALHFVDDDHLIVAETQGVMRLVAWRTGKLVEKAWTGYAGEVQYEPSTHLLRVTDGNAETRLWDVTSRGFVGPYVIADGGYMSGLLAADKPSEAALWTLDGSNVRREYTLAEIRGDLSVEAMTSRGKQPEADEDSPFFIDAAGRKYFVGATDRGSEIRIVHGGKKQTIRTTISDVSQIVASANGAMVAVLDGAGAIAVYKPGDRVALWTYADPQGLAFQPVWSADGSWLAVAGSTGAVVIDGKTGDVAYRRRVLGFEERQVLDFSGIAEPTFGRGLGGIEGGIIDI